MIPLKYWPIRWRLLYYPFALLLYDIDLVPRYKPHKVTVQRGETPDGTVYGEPDADLEDC